MTTSVLAGKPAPKALLVDLDRLEREYYSRKPDVADPAERVSFGTSGHRGSSLTGAFTEAHEPTEPLRPLPRIPVVEPAHHHPEGEADQPAPDDRVHAGG